jgi:hypothetical protein
MVIGPESRRATAHSTSTLFNETHFHNERELIEAWPNIRAQEQTGRKARAKQIRNKLT